MATARLYNLARMTTATTGTGTVTLGSAVTGFLSFASAGVADGATVTYAIKDGNNSEIGRGVYTSSGTTLTRATVLNSTNSNNALNLTGSAEVFITPAGLDYLPAINAQTGTTYTVLATDLGKLVTLTNAAAIAVTLPQATALFGAGWYAYVRTSGAGTATITPTTSTINGAATLVLPSGAGAILFSDGTNWQALQTATSVFSVPVELPDGSVSAPSLTNDGDENTGLWFPAADTIAISTAGAERLRIASDGKMTAVTTTSTTNAVTQVLRVDSQSSGTPANGIGVGIEFAAETAAGNTEVGATIEAITTDVTSTSEDFDLSFKTMAAGAAAAERMRVTSAGNFQFNSGYGSVATAYGCRAWVNFNGTGTVAIREDGNVSSITDNGTGSYTVNFTTAMPDVNYTFVATTRNTSVGGVIPQPLPDVTNTTSAINFNTYQANTLTSYDVHYAYVAIFR